MDNSTIEYLEGLICRKTLRYHDLCHCLEREKASLIDLNVDHLWAISREKEEICGDIEGIRSELFSVLNGLSDRKLTQLKQLLDFLPHNHRPRFQELFHTISRLKGEIDAMRKENMIYINESLQFLDEMITIITGVTQTKSLYTDKCQLRKSNHFLMLNREV